MNKTIWLVIGIAGPPSGEYYWNVCCYEDKDKATLHADNAEERAEEIRKNYWNKKYGEEVIEDGDIPNKYDPTIKTYSEFSCTNSSAVGYYIEEVQILYD